MIEGFFFYFINKDGLQKRQSTKIASGSHLAIALIFLFAGHTYITNLEIGFICPCPGFSI